MVVFLFIFYITLRGGGGGGMNVCVHSFCVSVRQRDLAAGLSVFRSVLSNIYKTRMRKAVEGLQRHSDSWEYCYN